MIKKLFFINLLLIINFQFNYSQNNFNIVNNSQKESLHFKLINNLILLPVSLNGQELTFLLDTGVKKSLLFNVTTIDSLNLQQVKKVTVKGLGEEIEFDALKSKNNLLKIGDIVCSDFDLLVILDKNFDFSARLGVNIHGIIGSELFKDFIININYNKRKIIFNNPNTYKYKKCKKCSLFPITFYNQKPYINGIINTEKNQHPIKLLIDSGSGDSLWLFEKSIDGYTIPNKNIKDILGRGLSGNIYGKKSKLKSFDLGKYKFGNLIISHPDSSSAVGNNLTFKRNGLIGSELLKRFHIIYDYPHKKISLKKNKSNFKNLFKYNKSGIELVHYGKVLVKEKITNISFSNNGDNDVKELVTSYTYSFKNAYQISYIKPNSVAEKAGIIKNDLITKINGKEAYNFSLQDINEILSDRAGKVIRIQVNRNGNFFDYKIKLEKLL